MPDTPATPSTVAAWKRKLDDMEAQITETATAIDFALLKALEDLRFEDLYNPGPYSLPGQYLAKRNTHHRRRLVARFEKMLDDFHNDHISQDIEDLFNCLHDRGLRINELQRKLDERRSASRGNTRAATRLSKRAQHLHILISESELLRLQFKHTSLSLSVLSLPLDVARRLFVQPLLDFPKEFTLGLSYAEGVLALINRLRDERRGILAKVSELLSIASVDLQGAQHGLLQPASGNKVQSSYAQLGDLWRTLITQRQQLEALQQNLKDVFKATVATPISLADQSGSPVGIMDIQVALQTYTDISRGVRTHCKRCDRAVIASEDLLRLLDRESQSQRPSNDLLALL